MLNHTVLKKVMIIFTILLIGIFFYFYSAVFMPILLALLTALMFEPLVRLLQKYLRTNKRLLAVTIIFTSFVLVSSITIYVTLTKMINEFVNWTFQLPQYIVEFQIVVNQLIEDFNVMIEDIPQKHLLIQELENQTQLLTDRAYDAAQNIFPILVSWVQAIPDMIVVTLFYLITLFLISLDLPRLTAMFYRFFKEETAVKIKFVSERLGTVFLGYWKAQFLLSILIIVLSYIGLMLIVPEHALIMSIVIWVVDIIPLYIGPALVLVPWAIYAFILGDAAVGTGLLILATVLLVIRRILEPKVMGDQMGLSALATVLSMYFGLYFLGVMGLILGPFVVIAVRAAIEAEFFKFNFKI
ncbi:sporulation integral membrane protein YtvI [Halalkalibacterium ligniniphilum]|uniref:sporulation integral membrane protein YtvI n=1 Tax=Halalkalibacterium ligniniphilum TaxID=1134413 RepID=UPI0003452E34|nr:sporulation integral membrane protein YtvI [Halalkalibacterium ligniniphilum]